MLIIILFSLILKQSEGVIYKLNDEDYNRMPPLMKLDDYDACVNEPNSLYCTVNFHLVSDQPSKLLQMIREYSEHNITHFNHTHLLHGVCLSKWLEQDPLENLNISIESFLNESFWREYKLKTKVEDFTCNSKEREFNITTADVCFAVVCFGLIILHILGSFLNNVGPGSFIKCFSMQQNLKKLFAAPEDSDPRVTSLRPLYGIKAINSMFVVLAHCMLPTLGSTENTHFIENIYADKLTSFILNGTLIVQTFFLISGFLLVFNLLLSSEKKKTNWRVIPQKLINRLLRLVPVHAFLLAFASTWSKFMGDGPLWNTIVMAEHNACKKFWWKNILFINNYYDDNQCQTQTWSLDCDMQLFILGLFIFVASEMWFTTRTRNIILAGLVMTGVIILPVTIYYYDLDGKVLVTPTLIRNVFQNDPNFNHLYKRGHTNLFNYILGMSLGYAIYYIQMKKIDIQKYKKYKIVYWSLIPAAVALIMSGSIYYHDGPRLSMAVRVIYGSISVILFGIIVMIELAGMILKIEDVGRNFVSWLGWLPLARASYSAFIINIIVVKISMGNARKLHHISWMHMAQTSTYLMVASYAVAVLLWLLIEAPINGLINKMKSPNKDVNTSNGKLTGHKTNLNEMPHKKKSS